MNKILLITILSFIAAIAVFAQNGKPSVITGYAPDIKDGLEIICACDSSIAEDTIRNGRFKLVVPVRKESAASIQFFGKDSPRVITFVYLAPGLEVTIDGSIDKYPHWQVSSSLPAQATSNRIKELLANENRTYLEAIAKASTSADFENCKQLDLKRTRKLIEILPTLPIDVASISTFYRLCYSSQGGDNSYREELRQLLKRLEAHHPEGYEYELKDMNRLLYPPRVVEVGDKACDTDFMDLQGNRHHLSEITGKYVLLDFWTIGCGPCMMSIPEMRYVYRKMKDRLEIVSINNDKVSAWKNHKIGQQMTWSNWSDGKDILGIGNHYTSRLMYPLYVLLTPDHKVIWKYAGFGPGMILGMMETFNSIKQDNSLCMNLVAKKVEADKKSTIVHFRFFGNQENLIKVTQSSYLTANGRKYKLTGIKDIIQDKWTAPDQKATDEVEGEVSKLCYKDFSLTYEPFDQVPSTFSFIQEGNEDALTIKDISTIQ